MAAMKRVHVLHLSVSVFQSSSPGSAAAAAAQRGILVKGQTPAQGSVRSPKSIPCSSCHLVVVSVLLFLFLLLA